MRMEKFQLQTSKRLAKKGKRGKVAKLGGAREREEEDVACLASQQL